MVLALAGALIGCAGDDDAGAPVPSSTGAAGVTGQETDVPYALASVPGWDTGEHLDPDASAVPALPGDPGLDWYSSYERTVGDGGITTTASVRVSGHALALDALVSVLPGRVFEPGSVGGFEARLGPPLADPEPPIVLLAIDDAHTVMVLSYELALDELAAWAEALRVVSDEEWAAVPSRP